MAKISLPRGFTGKYPSRRVSKRENRVIETAKNTILRGTDCRFEMPPIGAAIDGAGAAVTTDAVTNLMNCDGVLFETRNIATSTIVTPVWGSTGLDIAMDLTNNDGHEFTQGITARAKHAYTVGTDGDVFFSVTVKITDVSGTDQFLIGWRGVEAYQAVWTGYQDIATVNVVSGTIKTDTLLANVGTTTDSGTTWADLASKTVMVQVKQNGTVSYWIDGTRLSVPPLYTFTSGTVIVPFIYFLHDVDVAESTLLTAWSCGLIGR